MIEKPFEVMAKLARKFQAVATKVAVKAASLSDAMGRKVASIEARRSARIDARLMSLLPSRPTTEFVREVGRGRVTISLYRVTNHRAGTVRQVYGINRIYPDGRRVRLATGPAAELRSLRQAVNQPLGLTPKVRQAAERGPRPVERAASPKQQHAPPSTEARQAEVRPKQTRYFTLVYIEKSAPDGTAQGRVVKSFTSLKEAKRYQTRHPFLRIEEHTGERPHPRGQAIPVKLRPEEATRRIEDNRQKPQQQAVSNQVVNQPALQHQRKQELSR